MNKKEIKDILILIILGLTIVFSIYFCIHACYYLFKNWRCINLLSYILYLKWDITIGILLMIINIRNFSEK